MIWGAESWAVFRSGDERGWQCVFPGNAHIDALLEWQRRVLRAGEETGVLRVQRVEMLGYERSRDGYIGDYLEARPRASVGTIPGLIFDEDEDPLATTLITVLDADGDPRSEEVSNLYDFAARYGMEAETHQRPIKIYGEVGVFEQEGYTWPYVLPINLNCSIWFPWENNESSPHKPWGAVDNRRLAALNAPRLNAFLAEARSVTESVGGTWELGATTKFERFELSVDGIDLDAALPSDV